MVVSLPGVRVGIVAFAGVASWLAAAEGTPVAKPPDAAGGAVGFAFETGGFRVAWEPGQASVRLRRPGVTPEGQWLGLVPGGGDERLQVLELQHVRSVVASASGVTVTGDLGWAGYALEVTCPSDRPGLIAWRLDLEVRETCGPAEALFRKRACELGYATANGTPSELAPVFYLDGPVPSKYWDKRRDLNQFVFFGDPTVLRGTVFLATDFTVLNGLFEATGTAMMRVSGHLQHEDTVVQPPGAYGTDVQWPFSFGLDLPPAERPLASGTRVCVSRGFLVLTERAPGMTQPVAYTRRFLAHLCAVYPELEKPSARVIDWLRIARRSVADVRMLEKRRNQPILSETHFNVNPFHRFLYVDVPVRIDEIRPGVWRFRPFSDRGACRAALRGPSSAGALLRSERGGDPLTASGGSAEGAFRVLPLACGTAYTVEAAPAP